MPGLIRLAPFLIWPAIVSLPLILTYHDLYKEVFPREYYVTEPTNYWQSKEWPSPLGLSLGILAVIVGQIVVLLYFGLSQGGWFGDMRAVQKVGAPTYDYWKELRGHLSQPEGFVMLGAYLVSTWMLGLMPASYYSLAGGINWWHVAAQLLITDATQFVMHQLEHQLDKRIYRASHKPHHRFTNPKLFDAFNGSPADTFIMILIPLFVTTRCVSANVWSYMAFGALFANALCLIHAEHKNPWDRLFQKLGVGTSADHHVHHKLFVFNYGHLFMYWDMLYGTYRDPTEVKHFNEYKVVASETDDEVAEVVDPNE